jgi:hypothetical protein
MMVDAYGLEKFMTDNGARLVQKDSCGSLYVTDGVSRATTGGWETEPIVMVVVTNSTPEPDGHHRKYFLRVPPTMRTAREAVAWTFGLRPEDYHPKKET